MPKLPEQRLGPLPEPVNSRPASDQDVRHGHLADIGSCSAHVRFQVLFYIVVLLAELL